MSNNDVKYRNAGRWNKVAAVTLSFWVLKILATTLGETSGDLLAITLNLGYVAGLAITMVFLIAVLCAQLSASRFHAFLFWAAIVGTTTVGTEISDLMDRTLHLGYTGGSALLISGLLATLALWRWHQGRIRIHPITGRGEELFYWTAILFSNSLGTAFGDFLSDSAGLGYVTGALVTAGVIALVLLLHYATRLNHVLLFWVAFVFTRPFGATFGDFLTKPLAKGGLNFGTGQASAVTLALLVIVVGTTLWYGRRTAATPISNTGNAP
ncbi:COG4705 family protein [Salinisphaera aquimarina]|uniref:Membrane-anchored protein n=1 Tax=Salinisphaera aquimarina TaxID=2094031 RepID=A0ABV7EIG4_9GAMM